MTTLESTEGGVLRMKTSHWRTSKLREDMTKTKSRCQGEVKKNELKKQTKKKRILNYTMSVGICGQTSCGEKCY